MMCYYLNVQFQGQRVKYILDRDRVSKEVLKYTTEHLQDV